MNISVNLFYNLREKVGSNRLQIDMPVGSTIHDLKDTLIKSYPALQSTLDNIMVLINQKIALDEDSIPADAQVSFLTPIGGG